MSKLIDLTGQVFGKLTVLGLDHKKRRYNKKGVCCAMDYYWLCRCECGNTCIVQGNNLKSGHTKSCGCINKQGFHFSHRLSNTKLYSVYCGIKSRCYNKNEARYPNYGGRGIIMCDEWKEDFVSFYNWAMNNGYKDDLTIDRIDVNDNYCPKNCRWATLKEQANNKTTNHFITYKGITKTITQWAEEFNIDKRLLQNRIKNLKWDFEKAITTPPDEYKNRKNNLIFYNGEYKTKEEWIRILHIHPSTFYKRLKKSSALVQPQM